MRTLSRAIKGQSESDNKERAYSWQYQERAHSGHNQERAYSWQFKERISSRAHRGQKSIGQQQARLCNFGVLSRRPWAIQALGGGALRNRGAASAALDSSASLARRGAAGK